MRAQHPVGPAPACNRKRFPFAGTIDYQGLQIRVENLAGSTREGVDGSGRPWQTKMLVHYGELAGTEGADGEPVDVFVGPEKYAPFAYVVHQRDPSTGHYDEDKVLLGFPTRSAALAIYRAHYSRPGFVHGVRRLAVGELRAWLLERHNRGRAISGGTPLAKSGGPYIGPNGGKWADPQHKVHWTEKHETAAKHMSVLTSALKAGGVAGKVQINDKVPGALTITQTKTEHDPHKLAAVLQAGGYQVHSAHHGAARVFTNVAPGATAAKKPAGPSSDEQPPVATGGGHPAAQLAQAIAAATGLSEAQIRSALTATTVTAKTAAARAQIETAILDGGLARKDAVVDVLGAHDKTAHAALVAQRSTGDVARIQKELGQTPSHDVAVLAGVATVAKKLPGQALCTYGRAITVGHGPAGDYVTGDFRHELGHAVRFAYPNGSAAHQRVLAEYAAVGARLKATSPPHGASHDWYEVNVGVMSSRGVDNAEENFAEHYRAYHREVLRHRFKKAGGGQLDVYRKRHPGWAALWDARYTAAWLGQQAAKGTW